MTTQKSHAALADPVARKSYEEELLLGEVTETLGALIESLDISQRDLAERLGVSEGRVSQILSGSDNLTLRTVAACAWALGVRFELDPLPLTGEERIGTPAVSDPPAPAWLRKMRRAPIVYRSENIRPLRPERAPEREVSPDPPARRSELALAC